MNASVFNPIDFATRIKPIEAYVDTYNKESQALDSIAAAGDTVSSLITNNEEDKPLRDIYISYNNALEDAVKTLDSGDISSGMRKIRELSRVYYKDLNPISAAAAARNKDIENYRTEVAKGDYIGYDPSLRGVSSYMNGNIPNSSFVHGDTLYKAAMSAMSAASTRNQTVSDWGLDEDLFNLYFKKENKIGFSDTDVNAIWDKVSDTVKAGKTKEELKKSLSVLESDLYNSVQSVYDRYIGDGFDDNPQLKEKALEYILAGAKDGIGFKYTENNLSNSAQKPTTDSPIINSNKRIQTFTFPVRAPKNKEVDKETSYLDRLYVDADGMLASSSEDFKKSKANSYKNTVTDNSYEDNTRRQHNLNNIMNNASVYTVVDVENPNSKLDISKLNLNNYYSEDVSRKKGTITWTIVDKGSGKKYNISAPMDNKDAVNSMTSLLPKLEGEYAEIMKLQSKYSPMQIDGIPINETVKLGIDINKNKSVRNETAINILPDAAKDSSAMKSQVETLVANIPDNNLANSLTKGDGDNTYGIFDVKNGKRVNGDTLKKIKTATKESNITSVSIVPPDNKGGLRLLVSVNTGEEAMSFYMRTNEGKFQTNMPVYEKILDNVSTFNDKYMRNAQTIQIENLANYKEDIENAVMQSIFYGDSSVEIINNNNGIERCIVPLKIKMGDEGGFDLIKTYCEYNKNTNEITTLYSVWASDVATNGESYDALCKYLGTSLLSNVLNVNN